MTTGEGAALAGDGGYELREPAAAASFEQLVALHEPRVRRLAHRLLGWRGGGDVDDVVQEVFLVLLNKLDCFRGESSLATWLTRVTINRCRTHQRTRWLRLRLHRPPHFSEAGPPADQHAVRDEVNARVRSAVAALGARDREVIVLFYLEELPSSDIAALLGISSGAVDVRLHRARRRLKEKLGDLFTDEA
jgi:RNA polymerase sigma-70 factor (ECF subfamily)